MNFKYIDHPVNISLAQYEDLKVKLISQLLAQDNIISVYQMGSVNHPGISDLDIICVFKNESQCHENFRRNLYEDEKNILTHGLFGIEEKDLVKSLSYNFISNLKHLGGKDLELNKVRIYTSDEFKEQIALEYLVKMLVTINAQVIMGIIKLRAFLLLAKAIEFDLKLLNIKGGKLYDLVQDVIEYRSNWFLNKPIRKDITDLVLKFNTELKLFMEKELLLFDFNLPLATLNLPGNFIIQKHDEFSIIHQGIVLPNQFSLLGKKYINLQFKLNSYYYKIPFSIPKENSAHDQRFRFNKDLVRTNKIQYPRFLPLTTSLSIYG